MTPEDEEFNRIEREAKLRMEAVSAALDKMGQNARELGLDYEPAQQEPLRVAKVGQRVHGPELLPASVWRYQLRRLAYWVLMAILGMLWLAFLVACVAHAN